MTKKAATKQPNPIPNNRPFPKGVSGNPKGRPPKLPGLDLLLASVMGEEQNGVSAAETVLRALLAKASDGDVRAAELLLNAPESAEAPLADGTKLSDDFSAAAMLLSSSDA